MKVKDILPIQTANQEAFILDHGKVDKNGSLKYKDDMTSYSWNIKRYNKLHKGTYVLNRHSGKITKDRKFEIYSGGYVESITEPDADGNVEATITHAFTFTTPLKQGEAFLENFKWGSKKKKEGSWGHFWNQYGMNTISIKDFWNLVEGCNCIIPFDKSIVDEEAELTSSDVDSLKNSDILANGFDVTVVDEGVHSSKKQFYTGIAKKIDFNKLQKVKNHIGMIGGSIVFNMLAEKAKLEGLKAPEQVSVTRGDGLGYDILAFDASGNEIHVEVKTSTQKYIDGIKISANEMAVSQVEDINYKLYRIYNLNLKTGKCNLKIYNGPLTDSEFKIIPDSYILLKLES